VRWKQFDGSAKARSSKPAVVVSWFLRCNTVDPSVCLALAAAPSAEVLCHVCEWQVCCCVLHLLLRPLLSLMGHRAGSRMQCAYARGCFTEPYADPLVQRCDSMSRGVLHKPYAHFEKMFAKVHGVKGGLMPVWKSRLISVEVKRIILLTCIGPIVEYGSEVWFPSTARRVQQIDKVQTDIIKCAMRCGKERPFTSIVLAGV
jgi:hypothetical protein